MYDWVDVQREAEIIFLNISFLKRKWGKLNAGYNTRSWYGKTA